MGTVERRGRDVRDGESVRESEGWRVGGMGL